MIEVGMLVWIEDYDTVNIQLIKKDVYDDIIDYYSQFSSKVNWEERMYEYVHDSVMMNNRTDTRVVLHEVTGQTWSTTTMQSGDLSKFSIKGILVLPSR